MQIKTINSLKTIKLKRLVYFMTGAINNPAHTGTNKEPSHAINRGPIRKLLPKYTNVYVTIQSHGLSAGVQTHYVTANGVRNGLQAGGF